MFFRITINTHVKYFWFSTHVFGRKFLISIEVVSLFPTVTIFVLRVQELNITHPITHKTLRTTQSLVTRQRGNLSNNATRSSSCGYSDVTLTASINWIIKLKISLIFSPSFCFPRWSFSAEKQKFCQYCIVGYLKNHWTNTRPVYTHWMELSC